MTVTPTTWDMLHAARVRAMRGDLDTLWRRLLLAYAGADTAILTVHASYLPDLYSWFKEPVVFGEHLNKALQARGYTREVRIFLDTIHAQLADPGQRLFVFGPTLNIKLSDMMMTQSHEIALTQLKNLCTLLDHAHKVAAGQPEGIPTTTDKILREERYIRCLEIAAVFLHTHETITPD